MSKSGFIGLGSALLISGLAIVPATQAQTPIGELQESQGITISGTVISVVGNDFILDDGTGNIIVDAGPRWWHEINIEPGEELTVVGKLDNDEFDAISITKADGTVIQIRPASGPPPWAEGRDRR